MDKGFLTKFPNLIIPNLIGKLEHLLVRGFTTPIYHWAARHGRKLCRRSAYGRVAVLYVQAQAKKHRAVSQ
jgi:hypothetical protein